MWLYILSKGVFSGASRWHIVGAHQILDVLNGAGECLWQGGGSHSPAGDPPADAGWQPSELPRTTPVTGLSPRPRAGAGSLASEVCPGVSRRPEARGAAGLVLGMGSEPATPLGTPSPVV